MLYQGFMVTAIDLSTRPYQQKSSGPTGRLALITHVLGGFWGLYWQYVGVCLRNPSTTY
jgi:hypothetical protein